MSSFGAWSVKGIDDRARAAAKEQARLKGVTLGDYINNLLLQNQEQQEPGETDVPGHPADMAQYTAPPVQPVAAARDVSGPIDNLARRIEAAEARSTLAITGIDQSVLGLLARIEGSENNASAMAAEVEGMIDDLRETHEVLQTKVRELEHDDTAQKNLQTMKALEQALAKLANRVHDESSLVQEEAEAIKDQVESGLSDVHQRVENIESRIESRLADATERVQKVVEQAELRAEGTSRHLSERFSAVESSVATRLAKVDTIATRMGAIEGDVAVKFGALDERLDRNDSKHNDVVLSVSALQDGLVQAQTDQADASGKISELEDDLELSNLAQSEFVEQLGTLQDDYDKIHSAQAEMTGRIGELENTIELSEHVQSDISGRLNQVEEDVEKVSSQGGDVRERLSKVEDDVVGAYAQLERIKDFDPEHEAHFNARITQIEDEVLGAVDALEKGLDTSQRSGEIIAERVSAIEDDVSGAISSMEDTLLRIQDRLNRAETTTDSALKALEETFVNLDKRIESVAAHADPAVAEELRESFEQKFEELAAELRSNVEKSRLQLAEEIERAAQRIGPELVHRLEGQVEQMQTQIVDGHDRSTEVIQAIGEQVNNLAVGLNTRIEDLEARDDGELFDQVSEQLSDFTAAFESRIAESEQRSASAIEQVGQQVATAIQRVKVRQSTQREEFLEALTQTKQAQDTRLSKALSNISDRLTQMQANTAASVSPVQKAIVSLASRLEAVEDFTTPPHAERPSPELPKMPRLKPERDRLEEGFEPEKVDYKISKTDSFDEASDNLVGQNDFYADAPDYEESDATETDYDADLGVDLISDGSSDYAADAQFSDQDDESIHDYLVNESEYENPLSDLEDWEEDQFEAADDQVPEDDLIDNVDRDFEDDEEATDGFNEEFYEEPAQTAAPQRTTTDYLNRARRAAVAAAEEASAKKSGKGFLGPKAGITDLDLGLNLLNRKSKKKNKSKLPVAVATVSVLAVSTGAGGYVYMRGTQSADMPPTFTKAEFLGGSTQSGSSVSALLPDPVIPVEPMQVMAELAPAESADMDTELFDADPPESPVVANFQVGPIVEEQPAAPVAPVLAKIAPMQSLKDAANGGNPVAEYKYAEARLGEQNYSEGVEYITRAAQAGLPAAQYRLAKLHERGLGMEKDMGTARSWTKEAALGGNVKAMHDLAVFYADGEGGEQSYAAAIDWFRKAAEYGLVDSQFNLGVMYENGLGITADPLEALFWFEIAALNGDASAQENVQMLRAALPQANLEALAERLRNWVPAIKAPAANGSFGVQPWETNTTAQVRAVQEALNAFGFEAGAADGIAGSATRQAVRNFQMVEGLDVTGDIDKALVNALNVRISSRS